MRLVLNPLTGKFDTIGVQGPSLSTDNAIARFSGTQGDEIQNSNAIISDIGEISATTTSNSSAALTIANSSLKNIIIASTERPDLSASSNPTTFQVLTNGISQVFPGSSKTVDVQLNRVELGSGTQSNPVRAFRGIVAGSGSLVSSSNTKAGEFLNTWTSTGTLGTAIGAEYSVFAGGAAQVAGNISSAISQRLLVGFNSGTIGGSMSSATYLKIEEPSRTDGSNTIAQLNGLSIADLKKTGVTASYGILIGNQSSGGYAIKTGTGINEIGDMTAIIGSRDDIQFRVKGNATQTANLVVFEDSGGNNVFDITSNGNTAITTIANTFSAARVLNAAGNSTFQVDTREPANNGGGISYSVGAFLNGNQAVAGSANGNYSLYTASTYGSGTQSTFASSLRAELTMSGTVSQTGGGVRSGHYSAYWQSSGTAVLGLGIETEFLAGSTTQVTGLVDLAIGSRSKIGFFTGTLGGSITDAYGYNMSQPFNTDGLNTITNVYGYRSEDLKKTGVTNSYVFWAQDQSAGGYAIKTGTGLNELGDQVFINGSQDVNQLIIQGNATQTSNLVVFENSAGTDLITFSGVGGAVFNESAANADFRIESQNQTHKFFVDASTDRIGFNIAAPTYPLHSFSTSGQHIRLDSDNGDICDIDVNSSGIIVFKPSGGQAGITQSLPGGTAGFYGQNTDNTNSASNSGVTVQVGGASGGDPFIQLGIIGVRFAHLFLDNSDGDTLKYSANGFTGTLFSVKTDGKTGINCENQVSFLEVDGSRGRKVTTLNAATLTLDATHDLISVTYTATGAVTITLPSATSAWNSTDGIGRMYEIADSGCNAAAFNITINRAGADTISDNTTGNTSVTLIGNGDVIKIVAINATTWKTL